MSSRRIKPKAATKQKKSNDSEHKRKHSSSCLNTGCLDSILPRQSCLRILLMIVGIVCFAYWFRRSPARSAEFIARQEEVIEGKRFKDLPCPNLFKLEAQILNNEKCLPANCGRVVFDNILSESEASKLLEMAKKGYAFGGSSGPISILDLHSGALSKGKKFINVYKSRPDLFNKAEFQLYRNVTDAVHRAVANHFQISPDHLYQANPTIFQWVIGKLGDTPTDEYWHVHADNQVYPNCHYNSLLYLTDVNHDFKGGRFTFVDVDEIDRTVEPRLGRLSVFTPGLENLHYVERVTEGHRYVLQMCFSCDKSKELSKAGLHLG